MLVSGRRRKGRARPEMSTNTEGSATQFSPREASHIVHTYMGVVVKSWAAPRLLPAVAGGEYV